jgi:hypothetical protein
MLLSSRRTAQRSCRPSSVWTTLARPWTRSTRPGGHRRSVTGRAGVFLHDGALAGEIPLGADALAAARGLLREAVILKAARPIVSARGLRAILAQLDADFLFLGHEAGLPFAARFEQPTAKRLSLGL